MQQELCHSVVIVLADDDVGSRLDVITGVSDRDRDVGSLKHTEVVVIVAERDYAVVSEGAQPLDARFFVGFVGKCL